MKRILIGCEESDEVRGRLELYGDGEFDVWSCDLKPNRNPKAKHIQRSVLDVVNEGWDAAILFPPCTHLAASGAPHFEKKRLDGRQQQGIEFFMAMVNAPITHVAIENPIGIMSKIYRRPDQKIQPYFFGDTAQKTTCLWLKNLPPLYHNGAPNLFDDEVTHVGKGEFFEWIDSKTGKLKRQPLWYKEAWSLAPEQRAEVRSKTFPGIANAMAQQWGAYLKDL